MTSEEMEKFIVRYSDLKPCKTAFIDAHTPGSNQKENFTIIGSGVSESPDQHVHIKETPGFNIGAAGQPPGCTNSLHSHTTAEVFYVLKGRWRFFWGRDGKDGEVIASEGDLVNIPTGMFRAFKNIGNSYGMIMAVLGGDDAGGGVTWAPEVINNAKEYGLILGENGLLYDTKKGESLPGNVNPMPLLSDDELKDFPIVTTEEFEKNFFVSAADLLESSKKGLVNVIGKNGILKDRPGFEVDFITNSSFINEFDSPDQYQVNMISKGSWSLEYEGGISELSEGDTCLITPNLTYRMAPLNSNESSLFRVTKTNDTAGPTWRM